MLRLRCSLESPCSLAQAGLCVVGLGWCWDGILAFSEAFRGLFHQ